MIIDKHGVLVKKLDFRGTSFEALDKVNAEELFKIIAAAQQAVNSHQEFKVTDLIPKDGGGTVYQPIYDACEDKAHADRLLGVVIKQALIITPLLFRQIPGETERDGSSYKRESLEF